MNSHLICVDPMSTTTVAPPANHENDDWELVAANEVHIMEALKHEGNGLFQRKAYFDAIQVYAKALACIPPDVSKLTAGDVESLVALEIAVRLNRALAYIELQDSKLVVYAEDDCSAVLQKQPNCVKAYYRRALARERLGNIQDALADAERMHELEPSNPAAHDLLLRLQEAWSTHRQSPPAVSELSRAMAQQCSIRSTPRSSEASAMTPRKETTPETNAKDAWMALQNEEQQLRKVFSKHNSSARPLQSSKSSKKPNVGKKQPVGRKSGEVSAKTDSLWASLAQEEASTVARIYKRNGNSAPSEKLKTASIHPSR